MVFSKISVLVPTRGRIPRLEQMLASYHHTQSGVSELVFRVDNDDQESAEFLRRFGPKVMQGDRLLGYKSTPQFLMDMVPLATGDIFMVGNDDMLFETPEWDRKIVYEANRYPDGLFNIGVTTLNTTHFPFSIISRHVVETLGFMYDPRIFWGDIFLRDVMFGFGRTVLLPDVVINHNWAGYKPDKTFMEAQNFKETVGTHEYWELNALVVQEAIEKLRGVAQT